MEGVIRNAGVSLMLDGVEWILYMGGVGAFATLECYLALRCWWVLEGKEGR